MQVWLHGLDDAEHSSISLQWKTDSIGNHVSIKLSCIVTCGWVSKGLCSPLSTYSHQSSKCRGTTCLIESVFHSVNLGGTAAGWSNKSRILLSWWSRINFIRKTSVACCLMTQFRTVSDSTRTQLTNTSLAVTEKTESCGTAALRVAVDDVTQVRASAVGSTTQRLDWNFKHEKQESKHKNSNQKTSSDIHYTTDCNRKVKKKR